MPFYKTFDENLCCKGLQYTIGGTTTVEGEIKMCKNGIHCCKQALSCLRYYSWNNSRFCEVVPVGEMITEGNKTVCRSITVVREIVGEELSDLLSGPYKSRYVNGSLYTECTYEDGKLEGPCKEWYDDGKLWYECTYKNGKLEGPCKEWYWRGQLSSECSYKDGKLDGSCKKWSSNGQLSLDCVYKDGKLDGSCKKWFEGSWVEITYKDGNVCD